MCACPRELVYFVCIFWLVEICQQPLIRQRSLLGIHRTYITETKKKLQSEKKKKINQNLKWLQIHQEPFQQIISFTKLFTFIDD